jgi:hypothetical protein
MLVNKTGRRASIKAVFALMFYLVIPVGAIYVILNSYPALGKERFINMLYWFIPLSIVLVIVSQLSIRFPKGDGRRFMYNIAYVVITLLWLLAFLGGGLVITETWEQYHFSLHLWKYVLLIVGVALFNILYYVLEWKTYKNDIVVKETNFL